MSKQEFLAEVLKLANKGINEATDSSVKTFAWAVKGVALAASEGLEEKAFFAVEPAVLEAKALRESRVKH